jgi:hypothetical protein
MERGFYGSARKRSETRNGREAAALRRFDAPRLNLPSGTYSKSTHCLKIARLATSGIFHIRKGYRLAQSSPVRSIDAAP